MVQFVRDDRFRHLSQVPPQDRSHVMSGVRRLFPIQVLSVLSRARVLHCISRAASLQEMPPPSHPAIRLPTHLWTIIKHGLQLFHPFGRSRDSKRSRNFRGRVFEVKTAFGDDDGDVAVCVCESGGSRLGG
jgi:hypothetical protein